MKILLFLIPLSCICTLGLSQKISDSKLKFCLGKINYVYNLCQNYSQENKSKPINVNSNDILEDDEFKIFWTEINENTHNLTNTIINKEYQLNLTEDEGINKPIIRKLRKDEEGILDPFYWMVKFLSPNRVQITRYYQMGRVLAVEFTATYDLNTNQYRSVYSRTETGLSDKGRVGSTMNIIIENNKVVKKFRS